MGEPDLGTTSGWAFYVTHTHTHTQKTICEKKGKKIKRNNLFWGHMRLFQGDVSV